MDILRLIGQYIAEMFIRQQARINYFMHYLFKWDDWPINKSDH